MAYIYEVRHGQSESNAGGISLFPKLIKLSPLGIEQAKGVADKIKELEIVPTTIVFSNNIRTQQTAEPTIAHFPSARLLEANNGEFEYLGSLVGTASTYEQRRIPRERFWAQADPDYRDGDAETFREFMARINSVNTELQAMDETVIVFGHQMFMSGQKLLVTGEITEVTSETMRLFERYQLTNPITNGSLHQVDFTEGKWETLYTP